MTSMCGLFFLVGSFWYASAVRSQVGVFSEVFDDDLELDAEPSQYSIDRDWKFGGFLRVNFSDAVLPATITIKGEDASQDSREVSWTFNPTNVIRATKPEGGEETWGLLLNKLEGEMYLDFERAHEKWEVSINGKRTPWFDFEDYTQWAVKRVHWSNLTNVRLSLFYRECTSTCDETECKSCEVDGEPGSASSCRSISQDAAKVCEASTVAKAQPAQCCRGSAPAPRFASLRAGSWVTMTTDDDLVQRGCEAFENDPQKCASYKGLTMRVTKTFRESRKVELWVPTLPVAMNPVFVPVFLLEPKAPKYQTITIPHDAGRDIHVNTVNAYIYSVKYKAEVAGVPNNQYINRINGQPFTPNRWQKTSTSNLQFTITVVDIETPFGQCKDHPNWQDSDGDTCAKYRDEKWCDKKGEKTSNFKGKRCWLLFRCSQKIEDKAGTERLSAEQACCTCGGGYFAGQVIRPTPAPIAEPSPAPESTAPVSTTSAAVPQEAPTEIFIFGADELYPEHMGLFKLNVWKGDDDLGPAIYENVRHSTLYFNRSVERWSIADEKHAVVLVAQVSSWYRDPNSAVSHIGRPWRRMGSTTYDINMQTREFLSCGAKSDCNCPEPEYECKATVSDLYCYPGQIMQPLCGTLARCCDKRPTCDPDEWDAFHGGCGILDSPKKGLTSIYCPLPKCTSEQCCGRNCLNECGSEYVNETNKQVVCPDEGCDRSFCCKRNMIATTGAPAATPGSKDDISCEECMSADPEETQREVVLTPVDVAGLSYQKLVENYAVRTDVYEAVRLATISSLQEVNEQNPLRKDQCVVHIRPSGGGATTLEIILVPEGEAHIQATTADVAKANETGKLKENIQDGLIEVPNIQEVSISTVEVQEVHSPEVRTAVHERRLAQDVNSRGSWSIWTSYGFSMLREWGSWAGRFWYLLAAGFVIIGSIVFAVMYWLNSDNDEDRDVVG